MEITDKNKYTVKVIATFWSVKFLPKPLILGKNNIHPKFILAENEIEYRTTFWTRSIRYEDIEVVDVFEFLKTSNIYITIKGSVFTLSANMYKAEELYKCLKILLDKKCELTPKAKEFYSNFKK